jgi:hypothetical protein
VVPGTVLCRFAEGKSDFAKQNRPVLGAIVLPQNFSKKFYQKRFAISGAWLGSGGEVYIRTEGYEKTDTVSVMDEEKEKLRAHKTWYTSLYNKLLGGKHQK